MCALAVDGKTQLTGLIGWPVSHSFSPAMHNAAAADLGLNVVYVPLPTPPSHLAQAVHGLAALGFRGVNVTVPHKQTVMPLLDTIEEAAAAIGAVNTIVIDRPEGPERPARLHGLNTDWRGLLTDLQNRGVDVTGRDCIVLGAGGAARAVVYALGQEGGRVHVITRRPEQADSLVTDLRPALPPAALQSGALAELRQTTARCSRPLIVNTTPLGMTPAADQSPWPDGLEIPPDAFVYDLVYNPPLTRLLRQAEAVACQCANGLEMLLHQAALSFEHWTGRQPDIAVMQRALASVAGY